MVLPVSVESPISVSRLSEEGGSSNSDTVLESDIVVQSGVSGCLALTRLTVFLLLGRGWGRRGQLLWRRFLPCSAGGVLARPLCLMLIWLAALWRLTASFHLARRATIAPRPSCGWEFLLFTFTIPASGLLVAKVLFHNFLVAVGFIASAPQSCLSGHLHF